MPFTIVEGSILAGFLVLFCLCIYLVYLGNITDFIGLHDAFETPGEWDDLEEGGEDEDD